MTRDKRFRSALSKLHEAMDWPAVFATIEAHPVLLTDAARAALVAAGEQERTAVGQAWTRKLVHVLDRCRQEGTSAVQARWAKGGDQDLEPAPERPWRLALEPAGIFQTLALVFADRTVRQADDLPDRGGSARPILRGLAGALLARAAAHDRDWPDLASRLLESALGKLDPAAQHGAYRAYDAVLAEIRDPLRRRTAEVPQTRPDREVLREVEGFSALGLTGQSAEEGMVLMALGWISDVAEAFGSGVEPGAAILHGLQGVILRESSRDRAWLEVAAALLKGAVSALDAAAEPEAFGLYASELGLVLHKLGVTEPTPARLEESVAAYKSALDVLRDGSRFEWAIQTTDCGNVLSNLAQRRAGTRLFRQAVAAHRSAAKVLSRKDHKDHWAIVQNNLAVTLLQLGLRQAGMTSLLASAAAFRAALTVRSRTRDPEGWADTQTNLANTLLELAAREPRKEWWREAQDLLRDALAVRDRRRDPGGWALTMRSLASALHEAGKYAIGSSALREAVDVYRSLADEIDRKRTPLDWAAVQHNLGNVLAQIAQRESGGAAWEESIAAYRAALEERTPDRVPWDWAATLNNLALALENVGVRQQSRALIEEAVDAHIAILDAVERGGGSRSLARAYNNLGNCFQELGKLEGGTELLFAALEAYASVLEAQPRDTDPFSWAMTRANIGNTWWLIADRGNETAALEHAVQAYRDALDYSSLLPAVLPEVPLTRCLARLGRWAETLAAFDAALTTTERWLREAETLFQRERLLRGLSGLGRLTAYAAAQLGRPGEGLLALERGRAIALREALTLDDARLAASPEPIRTQIARERTRIAALRNKLGAQHGGAGRETGRGRKGQGDDALLADLRQAQEALDAALRAAGIDAPAPPTVEALLAAAPKGGALVVPVVAPAGGIAFVIPAGHTAIDARHVVPLDLPQAAMRGFLTAWMRTYGAYIKRLRWAMRAERLRAVLLAREEHVLAAGAGTGSARHRQGRREHRLSIIRRRLRRIEAALQWGPPGADAARANAEAALAALLSELGARLMAPIVDRLRTFGVGPARKGDHLAPELLIMPVGDLALMPLWACTWDTSDGRHALIDGYAVALTPSLTLRAQAPRRGRHAPNLCAVINPDVRFTGPDGIARPAAGDLQHAEEVEAPALRSLFEAVGGPGAARLLTGPAASRDELARALKSQPATYLHLACHGYYDWRRPADAGLILADHARLTVRDLASGVLPLRHCRLAVLSACETGFTDVNHLPDEGAGLVAAFLAAGARGVVTSLWTVDDDSTALFMTRLYAALLTDPDASDGRARPSPAQAVRAAALWLRDLREDEVGRELAKAQQAIRPELIGGGADEARLGDARHGRRRAPVRGLSLAAEKARAPPKRPGANPELPVADAPTLGLLCWAPFAAWGA